MQMDRGRNSRTPLVWQAALIILPVLLLATSRPEFRPSWADAPHATLLTLNRLGARQAINRPGAADDA